MCVCGLACFCSLLSLCHSISFYAFFVYFLVMIVFGCQLLGKTRLRSRLLFVKWAVKLYSLTHWLSHFRVGVLKGVVSGEVAQPPPRKLSSSLVWKWHIPVHFLCIMPVPAGC